MSKAANGAGSPRRSAQPGFAAIGSAIDAGGPFTFLVLILGAPFLWRVSAEDKLMARQFPSEYPAYIERTKALIPHVW